MPSLVKWAVESLGKLKVEEVVPKLIELLQDEQPAIRWVAVMTLARIGRGSADTAVALHKALQDADSDIQEAAAWALGQVERAGQRGA